MEDRMRAKRLPDAGSLAIDRNHYYRQVLHGYYHFDCVMGGGSVRGAKFYIPENSVYNQPTVFVAVPDETETYEFLETSGWKRMADERGLYLVAMEPDGRWGTAEEECNYISTLNGYVKYRPLFCAFSASFYGVAYGRAADLLGQQARRAPGVWAGIALLGTTGMTEDEKLWLDSTETKVPGVTLSRVQMPVWIVAKNWNEDVRRLVRYYRSANHSGEEMEQKGGILNELWCARVMAEEQPWEACLDFAYSSDIYDRVFSGVYRYPGNSNGALRRNRKIEERGFQKYTGHVAGGFYEDGHDSYQREWWVYVPESVKSSDQIPAVFVFHGAGGSGNEIADRSGWGEVAEKYGFIIICPTASVPNRIRHVKGMVTNEMFRCMWNTGDAGPERPADIQFVDYLYEWLVKHYPVDKSRIYASGQSSGGMMTWACACYRPDYFAAAAPVSAKIIDMETGHSNPPVIGSMVPVMANMGLEDGMFPGGFATEDARELVERWCRDYHLVEHWDTYAYHDTPASDSAGKRCGSKNGLFTNYLFHAVDGVPILRLVEAETKAHAIWPSECEMAWTEWFMKFAKDPDTKKLYYEEREVAEKYDIEAELRELIIFTRKELGITQKQLAQRSGISQANISKIENGNYHPSVITLQRIADGLGKRLVIEFADYREEL